MRPRPENLEPAQVLGYLGSDNVLYCSSACAAARGQGQAEPIDHDEYQALAEAGTVSREALVCPVCATEYPLVPAAPDDVAP
jgi:hypothetical protein